MKNIDPQEIPADVRLDALADVLAEGIVYLGQRGLLDFVPATSSNLPAPPEEGKSPNVPERP